MKNLGLLLLGIALGALAMYFYCSNTTDEEMTSKHLLLEPKGLIKPEEAMALDSAYNIKYRVINDSLFKKSGTDDNRSSWWAIEEIQNYINHAENQAGELGYTMDGLRVYLGSYPGKDGETGLTTMFFVPTGKLNKSQGSVLPIRQGGSQDIKGANGLNFGQGGDPPGANYPQ